MTDSKSGYKLLAPPEYAEAVKEPVPPYEETDLEAYEEEEEPEHPFQTGLFECFGSPLVCLSTFFCTPCVFGATSRLLSEDPTDAQADRRRTNWFHIDTPFYGLLSQISGQFLIGAPRRTAIREQLNIEGSPFMDWAAHFLLGPCAVAQESMEVSRYRAEVQARQREELEATPEEFHQGQAALSEEMEKC